MASVNPYDIAAHVRRRKKWKSHDMVPMHMGHEKIIDLRLRRSMEREGLLAEAAQPRTHVTEMVISTADDFDTRSVAAVAAAHRKFQFAVDEPVERRFVGEVAAAGSEQ